MKKLLKWVGRHIRPMIETSDDEKIDLSVDDLKDPEGAFKRERNKITLGIKFKFKF